MMIPYSIVFNLWLHAGSTYNGGTLQTTLISKSNANRAVGADSFFASTDRNFYNRCTNGYDSCTDFEYEPFEKTLPKCQRYYEHCYDVLGTHFPADGFLEMG